VIVEITRNVADAKPALRCRAVALKFEGLGVGPLQSFAERPMQAGQSVRGNAFDEIQLEKLERLQLEAVRQASPARAADLEHFSNLSMPVKQVAEHPIRAKEAGVPCDDAAQGRFGLGVALELHQRRAVVVERFGPVRLFLENRLQLRCRSRQIALCLEHVEKCRACAYIARAQPQRASELHCRGFKLAL